MNDEYLPGPKEIAEMEALAAPIIDPPRHRGAARRNGKPELLYKLPPHEIAAEQGVLGCCLLGGEALDTVFDRLSKDGHSAFYDLRHQTIFVRMREMYEQRVAIDIITVGSKLNSYAELEAVGGLVYLSELRHGTPSAAHIEHYLNILVEKFTLRKLLAFASNLGSQIHECSDVQGLTGRVQVEALTLTDERSTDGLVGVEVLMEEFDRILEGRRNGRQLITGIPTGLRMLDNMTCGLQKGAQYLFAARPGMGKTSFAITLAINAVRQKFPVAFFSVEMDKNSLLNRFVGNVSRVDTLKFTNGFLSAADEIRLRAGSAEVRGWGTEKLLFIDDRSDLSERDLYAAVRRAQRERGIAIAFVDYLQIMQATNSRDQRQDELTEIARWTKRVAKDLQIPVVALAQLNRSIEQERHPREPRLADLRESGALEQEADVVGMLWAPKVDDAEFDDMKWIGIHDADDPKHSDGWVPGSKFYKPVTLKNPNAFEGGQITFAENWRKEIAFIQLSIVKNRNGPAGPCELVFQKRTTRFADAYRHAEGDLPIAPVAQEIDGVDV